jgi:hypothetical protein
MAGEFAVDKERLEQVAQALLESKKMARTIENTAEALLPLTDNDAVRITLQNAMDHALNIAKDMGELYPTNREGGSPCLSTELT